MTLASNIPVPSPSDIAKALFPDGVRQCPQLPAKWRANVLLTPPGRGTNSSPPYTDQLMVGEITYEAFGSKDASMRCRLYQLESLKYFDIFVSTRDGKSSWWWLATDPSNPAFIPISIYGPFQTLTQVPDRNFLSASGFKHAGNWSVLGRPQNSFAGKSSAQAGTWFWFAKDSTRLTRIMNVAGNDFKIPIIGASYFCDFESFDADASIDLSIIRQQCINAKSAANPGPLVSSADIFHAFHACPAEATKSCTIAQIQGLIQGIDSGGSFNSPLPKWTEQVNSQCYMIGQDTYPYYCQLWYDWQAGVQVTVFVQQDDTGTYNVRFDEVLPRGKIGPDLVYSWNAGQWQLSCFDQGGGVVPMPAPDFVKDGGGRCRAAIKNNTYFGSISIWSVEMGSKTSSADFWYWFDAQDRGVVFSLAPAASLTLIDYQTFNQDKPVDATYLVDRSNEVSACVHQQLAQVKAKPKFKMPF
jgi:hypothetical protein